jgi:hypothetical protein
MTDQMAHSRLEAWSGGGTPFPSPLTVQLLINSLVGANTSFFRDNNIYVILYDFSIYADSEFYDQQWVLESAGNGNWVIRNRNTNTYLGLGPTLPGWPDGFSAPIILVSQRVEWTIRPAHSEENGVYKSVFALS